MDAINRADVIELIKDSYYNLADSMEDTWSMVEDAEKLPAVQAIPVEWIQQKIYSLGVTSEPFNEMAASILSAILKEYEEEESK